MIVSAVFFLSKSPSDHDQIQQALERSIKASKEGRPGGVLEYLSDNFQVNSVHYTGRNIADTIKQYKPDVSVATTEPVINGDHATITSGVTLTIPLVNRSIQVRSVTFSFDKELGTKFLVIPTKDWKLVKVSVPQEVVDQVASEVQ